jgi:hypothetical protein
MNASTVAGLKRLRSFLSKLSEASTDDKEYNLFVDGNGKLFYTNDFVGIMADTENFFESSDLYGSIPSKNSIETNKSKNLDIEKILQKSVYKLEHNNCTARTKNVVDMFDIVNQKDSVLLEDINGSFNISLKKFDSITLSPTSIFIRDAEIENREDLPNKYINGLFTVCTPAILGMITNAETILNAVKIYEFNNYYYVTMDFTQYISAKEFFTYRIIYKNLTKKLQRVGLF